jgi:hypothetical protein
MDRCGKMKLADFNKIQFRNLSGWLKAIVIISWIMAVLYGISFLTGFFMALVGFV